MEVNQLNKKPLEDRKIKEAEFHDAREAVRSETSKEDFEEKYPNQRFYKITEHSRDYFYSWLTSRCKDKNVLDYCSGDGKMSLKIAEFGGFATGIDVSELGVKAATEKAKTLGLSANCNFIAMDAEAMDFEDNTFDFAVCCGVLHHLDLDAAYKELSRVLKPGGEIICMEALAHNPIIHQYRKSTPELRTVWEVKHILRVEDIEKAQNYFGEVETRFFHLATLAAIPFIGKPLFNSVLGATKAIDSVLTKVPWLQKFAWQAIFVLKNPKK